MAKSVVFLYPDDQRLPRCLHRGMTMGKYSKPDPDTLALIKWCTLVEGFLVAGGATLDQAQQHIEEQVEWFTDQFYDCLTPGGAAGAAGGGPGGGAGGGRAAGHY